MPSVAESSVDVAAVGKRKRAAEQGEWSGQESEGEGHADIRPKQRQSPASPPRRSPSPRRRQRRHSSSASSSSSSSRSSPSSPRPQRRSARPDDDDNDDGDDPRLSRLHKEAKGQEIRQQLAKLASTRAGGTYIPPARLRALMAEAAAADPESVEYQRMNWDALKKRITGLVNKVAMENIKSIVPELFGSANLIRGRGLFCRSIMRAQMQSLSFTPVFAALTAIVNTKLPMIGELLLVRLISQFRRSFKRNDKAVCSATAIFIAHLVNQRVAHEIVALEMLVLLLEQPTDDSVEIAVGFTREVGAFLAEEAPKANSSIFDRFRAVLYEETVSKRVQYMIEVLSQVRRERYKDNPRIPEALDLVEEDDQITHQIGLDDPLNVEESLNVFRADPNYVENEEKYREIKSEILGEGSDDESDDEGSQDESGDDSDVESEGEENVEAEQKRVEIHDRTETNLVNLRRTIYLTIMSSAIFEEAVHKLMKLNIPEGQEIELCNMVIECCSQERTFTKFYGLIGERLCKLNRVWSGCYEQCFRNYYDSIHRYETSRLRNIARFFGWIIAADGISWSCFSAVHMTEEDTTSSSRIFIKILMGEMKERLGIQKLVERFKEPTMQEHYVNMMPRHDPKATRFSINFFTSIGVPQLTDGMREHLKIVREEALAKAQLQSDSSSDSDSSLSSSSLSSSSYESDYSSRRGTRRRRRSYSSSARSDSYSRSPSPRRRSDERRSYSPRPPAGSDRRRPRRDAFSPDRSVGSRSPSPAPRRDRRRRSPSYDSDSYSSDSRSPSPRPRSRRRSYSISPPPKRARRASPSASVTPPARARAGRRGSTRSPSYSPQLSPPRERARRRRSVSASVSRSPSPGPRPSAQRMRRQSRSPTYTPPPRRAGTEDEGATRL